MKDVTVEVSRTEFGTWNVAVRRGSLAVYVAEWTNKPSAEERRQLQRKAEDVALAERVVEANACLQVLFDQEEDAKRAGGEFLDAWKRQVVRVVNERSALKRALQGDEDVLTGSGEVVPLSLRRSQ
jgi:hypothetical protein